MNRDYAERVLRMERAYRAIYGPFWPGSTARDIRNENRAAGFSTCWRPSCLAPYRPVRVIDAAGKLHRLGRGWRYCSMRCYVEDRREQRQREADFLESVGIAA